MEENIYSIEILSRGKYESWDFEDEAQRDAFYEKVKERFAEDAIQEKNDDVDDSMIVQLSATSLKIKSDGDVDQIVPFEWYPDHLFQEILNFINGKYDKKR